MAWTVGLVASVTCLAACTAPTTAPGKSTPAHLERVSCASFASLPATGTVETPAPYRVTPRLFVSSKSRYDRLDPAERTELQASLAAAMQRLGALHCPTTPPVRSVPSTAPPAGIGAAGTAVSSTTSTAGDPTATAYFGARAGALELWAGGADVATSVPCTTLFGVTACAGEAAAWARPASARDSHGTAVVLEDALGFAHITTAFSSLLATYTSAAPPGVPSTVTLTGAIYILPVGTLSGGVANAACAPVSLVEDAGRPPALLEKTTQVTSCLGSLDVDALLPADLDPAEGLSPIELASFGLKIFNAASAKVASFTTDHSSPAAPTSTASAECAALAAAALVAFVNPFIPAQRCKIRTDSWSGPLPAGSDAELSISPVVTLRNDGIGGAFVESTSYVVVRAVQRWTTPGATSTTTTTTTVASTTTTSTTTSTTTTTTTPATTTTTAPAVPDLFVSDADIVPPGVLYSWPHFPASIGLDDNDSIGGLHWSLVGSSEAVGDGTTYTDTCGGQAGPHTCPPTGSVELIASDPTTCLVHFYNLATGTVDAERALVYDSLVAHYLSPGNQYLKGRQFSSPC
jgi:hypothetical protein